MWIALFAGLLALSLSHLFAGQAARALSFAALVAFIVGLVLAVAAKL